MQTVSVKPVSFNMESQLFYDSIYHGVFFLSQSLIAYLIEPMGWQGIYAVRFIAIMNRASAYLSSWFEFVMCGTSGAVSEQISLMCYL